MPSNVEIVLMTLMPMGIAAAFALAACGVGSSSRVGRLLPSLGVAVAYLAAHVTRLGWPTWPIKEDWQWVVYAALAGCVAGIAGSLLRDFKAVGALVRAVLRLAIAGAVVFVVTRVMAENFWTPREAVTWRVGLTGAWWVLWQMMAIAAALHLKCRMHWASAFWAWIMVAGAAALFLTGNLKFAELQIMLAFAVTGIWFATLLIGRSDFGAAWIDPAVAVTGTLWLCGYFFAVDDADVLNMGRAAMGLGAAVLLLGAALWLRRKRASSDSQVSATPVEAPQLSRAAGVSAAILMLLGAMAAGTGLFPAIRDYKPPTSNDDASDLYGDYP